MTTILLVCLWDYHFPLFISRCSSRFGQTRGFLFHSLFNCIFCLTRRDLFKKIKTKYKGERDREKADTNSIASTVCGPENERNCHSSNRNRSHAPALCAPSCKRVCISLAFNQRRRKTKWASIFLWKTIYLIVAFSCHGGAIGEIYNFTIVCYQTAVCVWVVSCAWLWPVVVAAIKQPFIVCRMK